MMLDCLIIQQPYASLIAYGKKKWEFRNYDTKKSGLIGIAASPSQNLSTLNPNLNAAVTHFPKGVILATAELAGSFFVTSSDLELVCTDPIKLSIHGHEFLLYDEPLGEPIEDVQHAIGKNNWKSHAWLLENIMPLNEPISFTRQGQSTWTKVDVPGLNNEQNCI